VRDAIAEEGPPSIINKALWFLHAAEPSPQDLAVLRVLAEGHPDFWATKEAKKILAEHAKQKP
jgi:hypothetical protein